MLRLQLMAWLTSDLTKGASNTTVSSHIFSSFWVIEHIVPLWLVNCGGMQAVPHNQTDSKPYHSSAT